MRLSSVPGLSTSLISGVLGGVLACLAPNAQADENLLGYSYGSETLPAGKNEAYLWATDRRGKGRGTYDAQDYSLELERGLTDRWQASLYLDFKSHDSEGAAPLADGVPEFDDVSRKFAWSGAKASFKYSILSPYKDALGLAVYIEPGFSRIHKVSGERGTALFLETKLIAQKNFLDDQLIWIGNLTYEQEFEHREVVTASGATEKVWASEGEFELSTGLSYRFVPNWFGGIEGRYSSIYADFPDQVQRAHYAFFVGPTLHYGAERWWLTLTYLSQLKGSAVEPARSSNRDFDEFEHRELRLKVGYNF